MSRLFRLALALAALASCTKANPAATCSNGTCTDPAFPFCDTDGTIAGEPGTCISVSCTAGAFAACRGSDALTCNASGDNYTDTACPLGCDASSGCKACEPNTTVCANGAVVTCGASGSATSTACPLGCHGSDARCTDIDPSNDLAMYLDMVPDPPDVHVAPGSGSNSANASINATTGDFSVAGQSLAVPTFLVPAGTDDAGIRVFVVRALAVEDSLTVYGGGSDGHGPGVAILATGDVVVNGPIIASAGSLRACAGGSGFDYGSAPDDSGASGGGGNATSGGAGGAVIDGIAGGSGGAPHGSLSLEPLSGGCDAGGFEEVDLDDEYVGPYGGGALQISSRTQIVLHSAIRAAGSPGYIDIEQNGNNEEDNVVTGGGAGGSILLEAPIVQLTGGASIDVRGGNGASFCAGAPTQQCGDGGAGSTASNASGSPGGAVTVAPGDTTNYYSGGGGGGGVGRIRVNTANGTLDLSANPSLVGDRSVGAIRSR